MVQRAQAELEPYHLRRARRRSGLAKLRGLSVNVSNISPDASLDFFYSRRGRGSPIWLKIRAPPTIFAIRCNRTSGLAT
jgi:hypothetical protein